jgi:hypothetical protein
LREGDIKFIITDDNGRPQNIRIPNSLYVPGLKKCLLSPQHWVQEVADNKTQMGNFAHCCVLNWCRGQKTKPFSTSTNTPTFFKAPSLRTYQAFTITFEAMKAPFFQRETVLQVPGCMLLKEVAEITPEEFVAEEDFHCGNRKGFIDNKADKDNKTIHTSNIPDISDKEAAPDESIRHGPPTFDPSPPISVDKDIAVVATDDQTK